ncbi:MAG: regulatory protein RecX [Bdellovibrionales bacterium]|jgi:regulatory protein|nr:regulatory protein RecX [Bdellovibrionales bacterium]
MDKNPAKDQKKKRVPRKITPRYLENAALYYLQRYATSVGNLRRVLTRKVDRSCQFHETPPDAFYPLIEDLLQRYEKNGLLNDTVYAEGRVSSLRRQGKSRQAITGKLKTKGLAADTIETALHSIDGERSETDLPAELAAALKLARKRKIGRFNTAPETDPLLRRKEQMREMGIMARGGFSFDIARQALDYNEDDTEAAGADFI